MRSWTLTCLRLLIAAVSLALPLSAHAQLFSESWESGSGNWYAADGQPITLATEPNICSGKFMRDTILYGGGRIFTNGSYPVTVGSPYCLTAWVRGTAGTCPFLAITGHWMLGQLNYPNSFGGAVVPVNSDGNWHWYSVPFTADRSSIALFSEIWGSCAAGAADFDDIQVWAGACPAFPTGAPHVVCSGATPVCDTTRAVCVGVPAAPVITSPANNASLVNTNNAITGTAAANSTVTIRDNGAAIASGPVAANGTFNITVTLSTGAHPLTAVASNAAGTGAASATVTVTVGPQAPLVTTPSSTTAHTPTGFTVAGTAGSAVAGATITIYDNGALLTTVSAAADGSYTYTRASASVGVHSITLTQTAAGRTSPATVAYSITVHNDGDLDGVYDEIDNCPLLANRDQVDRDVDGLGDVCDQAPAQADSSNQTTSSTDAAITSLVSAETALIASNQANVAILPPGSFATASTFTLVVDPSNVAGNIQLMGKASAAGSWTPLITYDLQLGPSHPALLLGGNQAQVAVVTPRTSLANYAFRYKLMQVRVKELDGTNTFIPHCNNGTVSAADNRCVGAVIAYSNIMGTNVDVGIRVTFTMKSL